MLINIFEFYKQFCTLIMSFIILCVFLQIPVEIKAINFRIDIKYTLFFVIREPYMMFKSIKVMGFAKGIKYETWNIKNLWKLGYFKYGTH